jgi:quercetin dioxygenase-like cupin family protein
MNTEGKSNATKGVSEGNKVLLENERVRVLEVFFKPGDFAKMHHHPDHVVYVVKGGKLKIVSEGKTNTLDLISGSAVFLEAQDHEVTNLGNSDVDLIVVELKK